MKGGAADADLSSRLSAAAQAMGLALDEDVLDRLITYLHLLQRWNRVYNLTALREPDQMLSHHLVDCLAVLPPLRRMLATWPDRVQGQPLRLLDVGSGGGLPGVVLAAAEPLWQVSCVDAAAKKASFIRQVAAELRLPNLHALHARVETLGPAVGPFDVIISRAFASLADFTRLSQGLLAERGIWIAMKGKPSVDELASLPQNVQMFHVEQLEVPGLDAQRCLVWMRHQSVAAMATDAARTRLPP